MRPLPTAVYPDKTEGVTLKCSRKQETVCSSSVPQLNVLELFSQACYRDGIGPIRAYNLLGSVARRMPVHLIYGATNDYLYII